MQFSYLKRSMLSFACSLLRQGMKQIIITLDSPEIEALEKTGDKAVVAKVNTGLKLMNY